MSHVSSDPTLLYSVNNIRAFHIQDGEESDLTPSGPQTLSLLMVPTSAGVADAAPTSSDLRVSPESPEQDFYLHLHLPPELDLSLPATTQIFHQFPNSYLIPRWDIGLDAGAFIRIEFPDVGAGPGNVSQEDIDTFETILAQCTAFLERVEPPAGHVHYNPADYAPGEGYISSRDEKLEKSGGKIVLIDEEDGSVMGELTDGYDIKEKPGVRPGSKTPVEIQLPTEDQANEISIDNVSEEYLRMAQHPAFANSTIVQTSAAASRLIVTGSSYIANMLTDGADTFTRKTKPNPKPLTFSEATQARIRKISSISHGAANLSAKTLGSVSMYAQNFGATLARRKDTGKIKKGYGDSGKPLDGYKPGIMNKSMIAFSTLADGIEQGARNLMLSGSTAASTMVSHRYGPEAGAVAANITGGFRNVGLVYIDATGVSRRAVLKSVAKGMVVGRMKNGQQVVVSGSGGDGNGNGNGNGDKATSASLSKWAGATRDPVVRRPSQNQTPPPAYSAPSALPLSGMAMSGSKR